jgi:hypothetical protein
VEEFARGHAARLTFAPPASFNPIWSPDGRYVAYGKVGRGIYRKPWNGAGAEELLLQRVYRRAPGEMRREELRAAISKVSHFPVAHPGRIWTGLSHDVPRQYSILTASVSGGDRLCDWIDGGGLGTPSRARSWSGPSG